MKTIIILLLALSLSGCATSYQDLGDTGGYYHQKVTETVYRIGFRANGFTDFKKAKDFAMLRAAGIGNELGFDYMALEGVSDHSKTAYINTGSTSYTTGQAYNYGATTSYYGTTNTYSNTVPVKKPHIEYTVRYFRTKPQEKILDLKEVKPILWSLRSKYGVK